MTNDDDFAAVGQQVQPSAAVAPNQLAGLAGNVALGQRLRRAGSRGRPWWRWLLIGILLLFCLVITILCVTTLTADIMRHNWGGALDASRDAVPAAVGWAALLIVFCASGTTAAERLMMSADQHLISEKEKQAAKDEDSVYRAEQRVRKLTASLAALTRGPAPPGREPGDPARRDPEGRAGLVAAGTGSSRQIPRQIADTKARLDQARQWLTGARAALAASQQDLATVRDRLTSELPDPAEQPSRTAGRAA